MQCKKNIDRIDQGQHQELVGSPLDEEANIALTFYEIAGLYS
jgi:hypothetical protein